MNIPRQRKLDRKFAVEALEERVVLAGDISQAVGFDPNTRIETVYELTSDPAAFLTQIKGFEGVLGRIDAPDGSTMFDPDIQIDDLTETVHGADDRILVTNTTAFPFNTVTKLYMNFPNGNFICSGAIVSSFQVLTAGHCVNDADAGGWANSIQVVPAKDGTEQFYGTANATFFRSYTNWTIDRDRNHDWALISLDRRVGDFTGWMGREVLAESSYNAGIGLNTAGYPGDRDGGERMYRAFGSTTSATDTRVFYSGLNGLDTAGGQSGSALWRLSSGDRYINTIHTTGGTTLNGGTRLNTDKFNRLTTWINEDDSVRPPVDRADLVDYDAWFGTSLSFMSTSSVMPGNAFSVTAYPRNSGTATAANYVVSFYASTNTIISGSDFLLGSTTIGSTAPFNWSTASLSSISFPNIPAGEYYVGWLIDSGGNVSEFSESNNSGLISSPRLTVVNPVIPPDAYEDNDNLATASLLSAGDHSLGGLTIDVSFDDDYYAWTAPASGNLNLDIAFSHAAGDVDLDLLDASGNLIDRSAGVSDTEFISQPVTAFSTYYVRVFGYNGALSPSYSLNIDGPAIPEDSFEQNDTLGTAAVLAGSQLSFTGLTIDTPFDDDYYAWTAAATGNLAVQLDFAHYLGDVDVQVLNASGNFLGGSFSTTDQEYVTIPVTAGETYAVRVYGYFGAVHSNYAMQLLSDGPTCDFDSSGTCDIADLDLLYAELGGASSLFDLDATGLVDDADLSEWLSLASAADRLGRSFIRGDSNLDGSVSGADFTDVASNFGSLGNWSAGNFVVDPIPGGGAINGADFTALASNFGFTSRPTLTRGQEVDIRPWEEFNAEAVQTKKRAIVNSSERASIELTQVTEAVEFPMLPLAKRESTTDRCNVTRPVSEPQDAVKQHANDLANGALVVVDYSLVF